MTQALANIDGFREAAAADPGRTRQFVTFTLGEQPYCVDIMSVREVRTSNAITPLPGAPDFVRGVINLRGTIVPILDLRARFGQGRTEPSQSHAVVIVTIDGRLNGLLVDGVSDILSVGASKIAPIPESDGERRNPFFEGLVTQGDTMLIVIGLDRVTKHSEAASGRSS
jgi:purine-binding chemotaxis protein CheW